MWGRLNPDLGWKWKGDGGTFHPYVFRHLSRNAGMLTGIVAHNGVLATRPMQEFDMLAVVPGFWQPLYEIISLVPTEVSYDSLRKPVMPVQIRSEAGVAPVL